MSNFATHFPNIEEIPMGHLIDKLNNLRQVENPDTIENLKFTIVVMIQYPSDKYSANGNIVFILTVI
jgi:hypothetical protein